jgi:hypothetical protein
VVVYQTKAVVEEDTLQSNVGRRRRRVYSATWVIRLDTKEGRSIPALPQLMQRVGAESVVAPEMLWTQPVFEEHAVGLRYAQYPVPGRTFSV